jgi:AraC-like DNA-binding protein
LHDSDSAYHGILHWRVIAKGGAMHRMRFLRPAPGLEGFVRCYAHEFGEVPDTVIHPVHARAAAILAFTFGGYAVADYFDGKPRKSSHNTDLIGMQTYRRLELHVRGSIDSFFILFQPAGVNRLFSLPMHEFTDQDFEGEAVLGPVIAALHERLGECRSFEERVSVVDRFLLRRAMAAGSVDGVTAASNLIIRRGGCERIPALADSAGLSLRQFERRFMQQVGMGPKLFARIARFEAVMDLMARAPTESWTSVAHRFGYFDQMHMVHEFAEFTGQTPTETLNAFKTHFRDVLAALESEQDPSNALRDTRLII